MQRAWLHAKYASWQSIRERQQYTWESGVSVKYVCYFPHIYKSLTGWPWDLNYVCGLCVFVCESVQEMMWMSRHVYPELFSMEWMNEWKIFYVFVCVFLLSFFELFCFCFFFAIALLWICWRFVWVWSVASLVLE